MTNSRLLEQFRSFHNRNYPDDMETQISYFAVFGGLGWDIDTSKPISTLIKTLILDHFVRFWFYFIALQNFEEKRNSYTSLVFEELSEILLNYHLRDAKVISSGSYWDADIEIDILTISDDHSLDQIKLFFSLNTVFQKNSCNYKAKNSPCLIVKILRF